MKISANNLRRLLNWYGPFLGAGIRVTYLANDWRECHVQMKVRWYNRNYVGTHFGGSLFAMVDPQLMLMLLKVLGSDYIVWDKSASIDFVKASKLPVTAVMKIEDAQLQLILEQAGSGEKALPEFHIEITDTAGVLVARVHKTLYVRKKNRS